MGFTSATTWLAAQQKSADAPIPQSTPLNSSAPSSAQSLQAKPASVAAPPARSAAEERFEGEKKFRANCSRCHQFPHKFPPRAIATIIRHMRVRVTITDEDARLILKYMSQ
jgi:cytochrome c5